MQQKQGLSWVAVVLLMILVITAGDALRQHRGPSPPRYREISDELNADFSKADSLYEIYKVTWPGPHADRLDAMLDATRIRIIMDSRILLHYTDSVNNYNGNR